MVRRAVAYKPRGRLTRYKPLGTLARAAGRVNMSQRGFVGRMADAKFFDDTTYNIGGTILYFKAANNAVHLINTVPQGAGVNARIGKAYKCQSVTIRGEFSAPTSGATVTGYSLSLVWDYSPNKALATVTDIYDVDSSYSMPRRENALRFKILKEWRGHWQTVLQGGAANGQPVKRVFERTIKLAPDMSTLLTAADTTGVIGDMVNGALLLVARGDGVSGTATDNPYAYLYIRLNFTD